MLKITVLLAAGLSALAPTLPGGSSREPVPEPSEPRLVAVRAESAEYYRAELARIAAGSSVDDLVLEQLGRIDRTGIDDFTSCPSTPPGGIPGVTNDGFYFLSEILPAGVALDSPACGHFLRCFLGQMVAHQQNPANPPSPHSEATLIIDRQCVVHETLILPKRFVLAGVGIEGRGVLLFDLPDHRSALRFGAPTASNERFTTIRDLNIVNASCCGQVGINLSNSHLVNLERLRVHNFGFGVVGSNSFANTVRESDIHDNGFNLVMGDNSTTWRIRDTTLSRSGLISVVVSPTARGHLVSGGVLESNPITAVWLQGILNVFENSWYEGNGIGFGDHGIRLLPTADQNRILGNLFSSEDVLDSGSFTNLCFNVDDDAGGDVDNCGI
jgi:hypothetical protein